MLTKVSLIIAGLLICAMTIPVAAQQPTPKTFTTNDQFFSFDYPADWFVEVVNADQGPNASIAVNNLPLNQRIDSKEGVNLQFALPKLKFQYTFFNATSPKDAVAQLARPILNAGFVTFGTPAVDKTPRPLQIEPAASEVKEFFVTGRASAYGYNITRVGSDDYSQFVAVVDLGSDYWVIVQGSSFKGGLPTLQKNEPVFLSTAEKHEIHTTSQCV